MLQLQIVVTVIQPTTDILHQVPSDLLAEEEG